MFRLVLLIVIVVIFLFMALYLVMIRPSSRRTEETVRFAGTKFAHRGLHDDTAAENTLEAFRKARDAGYGIELDVRLTKDRQVVVFHDDTLLRAAGRDVRVADLTYDDLSSVPLFGTDAHIPLFSVVLSELTDTPLLVELKCETKDTFLAEKTAELLARYPGPYAIESFNPLQVSWFRKNRPDVLCGQLVQRHDLPKSQPVYIRFVLSHMLLNGVVRPDFLACNIADIRSPTFRICRLLYRPVLFGWTVRTAEDLETAAGIFDTIIFEKIRP